MTTQEHAWTAIRTQHPDVSHDVMVVASGSDPCGKRLKSGSLRLWQLIDQATDRLEVLVSGEGLRRSPATLATGCCLAGRAGRRHSNRPCCSSYPGPVLPFYGNGRRAVLPRPRDLQQRADSCLSWPGIGFFSALRASRGGGCLGLLSRF